MKSLILFLIAGVSFRVAATAPNCDANLSVSIDLNYGIGLEVYDVVRTQIDWRAHSGRSIDVAYIRPGVDPVVVTQSVYAPNDFARLFPNHVARVTKVVELHRRTLAGMARHWKWIGVKTFLRVVGLGRRMKDLDRAMPGELGIIAIDVGPEQLSTDILSGLIDGRGKAGGEHDQLRTLLMGTDQFRERLPMVIARTIERNGHDQVSADVLIFHTHPGAAAPLSPNDDRVIAGAQKAFAREFPYVSFRFLMVAGAKLEEQGDLFFVKELRSPATANLRDLLRAMRNGTLGEK